MVVLPVITKGDYNLFRFAGLRTWELFDRKNDIWVSKADYHLTTDEAQAWADKVISEREDKEMTERTIPTKEQVLEAAAKCPDARKTLEILFPGDFVKERVFENGNIVFHDDFLDQPRLVLKFQGYAIFVDLNGKQGMIGTHSRWESRMHSGYRYTLAPDCNITIKYRDGRIINTEVKETP